MKRRTKIKLFLSVCGGLIAIPSFIILFLNIFLDLSNGRDISIDFIQISGACISVGLVPISIALLMQSKDIAERNRGISELLKILSWFWIVISFIILIWFVIYVFFVRK